MKDDDEDDYIVGLNSKAEPLEQVMPGHRCQKQKDVDPSERFEISQFSRKDFRRFEMVRNDLSHFPTISSQQVAAALRVLDGAVVGTERLLK